MDLARERTIVLQEEILNRIAQEQNSRTYVLTIVAAIFLPLSFLTGVFGMNRKSRDMLKFSKRKHSIKKKYSDYTPNNEVYMSYLIEKYKVPYTEIGMRWNFILDNTIKNHSAACYFVHQVNKNFKEVLNK